MIRNLVYTLLWITMFSCSDKDIIDEPLPPQLGQQLPPIAATDLTLSTINDNQEADGVHQIEVVVKAAPSVRGRYREVSLETNSGLFTNTTANQKLTWDAAGEAHAFLSNTSTGTTVVSATSGDQSRRIDLHFISAYPDVILLEPTSTRLTPSLTATTTLTAKLSRSTGTITPGQTLVFYDSTTTGSSIGVFLNTTKSNGAGEAISTYSLLDMTYQGTVYLKAFVSGDTKHTLGTTRIVIQ